MTIIFLPFKRHKQARDNCLRVSCFLTNNTSFGYPINYLILPRQCQQLGWAMGEDQRVSHRQRRRLRCPAKYNRLFIETVMYRAKIGCAWKDLPERYG